MLAILLTMNVISIATGKITKKSIPAATNRFQKPTTYTLGGSRRVVGFSSFGCDVRAGSVAATGGDATAADDPAGVAPTPAAGSSRRTAGSRSDIVDLYGAATPVCKSSSGLTT